MSKNTFLRKRKTEDEVIREQPSTQEDVTKLFLEKEGSLSKKDFMTWSYYLSEWSKSAKVTKINDVALITWYHDSKRALERCAMPREYYHKHLEKILQNEEIFNWVCGHPVVLGDDGVTVEPERNGVMATAIVSERDNAIYIVEAGYAYIRCRTVASTKDGVFELYPGTACIKLHNNGMVSYFMRQIPEVTLMPYSKYQKSKERKKKTA